MAYCWTCNNDRPHESHSAWRTSLLPAHCLGSAICTSQPDPKWLHAQLEAWGQARGPTYAFKLGPKRILVTSNVDIARPPRSRIGLAASGACPRSNLWPRRWRTTVFSQLRERRGARSAARSLRTSFYPAGHLLQRPSARGARRNCALSMSGRRLAALNLAKLKQIAKTSAVLGQHLPNSCARTVRAIISGDLPPEGRERSTRCRPNTTHRLSEYVAQGPDNSVSIFCLSNSRPRWMIRGVSTRMLAVRGRPPSSAAEINGSKPAHSPSVMSLG